MTRKRGRLLRGLLVACVLAIGLVEVAGAAALSDGDPCSPFWTQNTPPSAVIGLTSPVQTLDVAGFGGTSSSPGTADRWTFVSAASECDATSTVPDPISTYTWNFGDGSPVVMTHSPTTSALHMYDRPGTYTVTLTVTEQNCQSGPGAHCFTDDAAAPITVENRAPIALFTGPDSVATGRPASFDASHSYDLDGAVTAYHWDFGDGKSETATAPTTTHVFTRSGPKTVTLTVTDDSGATSRLQQPVSVTDRPPSASFIGPVNVGRGQTANFNASASSDPDGTITNYEWDFGDGTTRSTVTPVTSHTYNQPGPKTVMLTVVDDAGNSDHTQQTVDVTAALQTTSVTAPTMLRRSCVVPRLIGRHVRGARHALKGAGCRLGTIRRKSAGARRRGRVIRQSLTPGAIEPAGRPVAVIVGR